MGRGQVSSAAPDNRKGVPNAETHEDHAGAGTRRRVGHGALGGGRQAGGRCGGGRGNREPDGRQCEARREPQFYDKDSQEKFAAFQAKTPNTHLIVSPFEALALEPNSYDFMMINLNYHDVYWESAKYGVKRMEPDAFLKTVFAAMKPGGIVGVIDHVGNPGDTRETVEKFHRIDPAVVKADFERVGFKLEAESDILRNPADDHSLLVFNPQIRGKTDRFIYKFRKPS